MNSSTRCLVAFGLTAALLSAHGETPPGPYAGQQARAIKALSDNDTKGLLDGSGAGFAKAAELNGYPGPAHVLELSSQLHLDAAQEAATRELLAAHKSRAREIGAELVAAERELDQLFSRKQADPSSVDQATHRIGQLQAQLRAEHLKTHLSQTALLNPHQIHEYAALRGYASGTDGTVHNDPAAASTHHH